MSRNADTPNLLSIGKLSQEAGIHASTLRVWEARYQMITPVRTEGGARRYTQQDCLRLKWIKALVELGYKPRELAALTLEELKVELDSASGASDRGSAFSKNLVIGAFGANAWAKSLFSPPTFDLGGEVRHVEGLTDLEQYAAGLDVIIIVTHGLQVSLARRIAELSSAHPGKPIMVVYEFSSAMALGELQRSAALSLRYPVSPAEFSAKLRSLAQQQNHAGPQQATYSPESLQAILTAEHKILCECPKHLAQLLLSLHGFVEYSGSCANDSPAEAIIHGKIKGIAMESILMLESGLKLALGSE